MRVNVPARNKVTTHEGGCAVAHITPEQQLRRSVMSCLLWEDEFYEDGQKIADRITEVAAKVKPETLAAITVEARHIAHLRHVPLLLLDVLSSVGRGRNDGLVSQTVAQVVSRVDEMAELLAMLWRMPSKSGKRKMIPAQVRNGLAQAFSKFDEYQLAKYDRDGKVKLRDVLRMVRPKPVAISGNKFNEAQTADQRSALYKRIKTGDLATPDTWESELVSGKDKRETFERLIREDKLGYLALLRNLRKMLEVGVDEDLVRAAIVARKGARHVLPFRYVAAARAAPRFEPSLDQALCAAIDELPILSGKTIVLVDVSGSMADPLSRKSDMRRVDAAGALASIVNGDVRVFWFNDRCEELPYRRGMAGVDQIVSRLGGGTRIGDAVAKTLALKHDRLVVITDEQSHDDVMRPAARHAYLINVASAQNGVGYGQNWVHVDGFSENVIRFIHERERGVDGSR